MLFQPVEVAVHGPGLSAGPFDAQQLFVVDHASALRCSQFFIETVVNTGTGARQVVNASVKYVSIAVPTRAQSAGNVVHFENLCFVPVHPSVTSGGKACQASPNNDDRLFFHFYLLPTIFIYLS